MSVRLLRAFNSRLRVDLDVGDSAVTNPVFDAVGGRIHALEAPASSALPLIVFDLAGTTTEGHFEGGVRTVATFDVTIFAKAEVGLDAVALIEEKVFVHLHDQNLSVSSGFDRAYVRAESRGTPVIEGEFLRVDSTFIVEGTDLSTVS
mgnify:FL=1